MRILVAALTVLLIVSLQTALLASSSEWALNPINVVDRVESSIEVVLSKPGCVDLAKLSQYLAECRLVCQHCGYYARAYLCNVSDGVATYIVFEPLPLPGSSGSTLFPAIKVVPRITVVERVGPYVASLSLRIHTPMPLREVSERLASCGWRVLESEFMVSASLRWGSILVSLSIARGPSNETYIAMTLRANATPSRIELERLLKNVSACLGIELEPSMLRSGASIVVTTRIEASATQLRQALARELAALRSTGIARLTQRDLEEIYALAEPGAAGWSNRIVYFNGSWVHYWQIPSHRPLPTSIPTRILIAPVSSVAPTVVSPRTAPITTSTASVATSSPQRPQSLSQIVTPILCIAIAACIGVLIKSYLSTKR